MPFERPTLSELRAGVASDLSDNLSGADALLRFSNLFVIGTALAGMIHAQYGYLDWIAKQAVPFTATDEYLEAWAGLKGVTRKTATAAAGAVTFTGTAGTDIPSGTALVRSDGAAFATTSLGTVGGGGTVTVPVSASVAGQDGNTAVAAVLTIAQPIAGVQSSGAVSTAIGGGADAETDDSLRSRMLQVYASPPQGGSQNDYIEWAKAVPGVTRAWCVPMGAGIGTVHVYIMLDVVESAFDGFPQGTDGVGTDETRDTAATGDQLTVADYIFPLRPVTALVYVKAPIANPVNFTIANISGVSAAIKTKIAAAISDVFRQTGEPGGTVDLSDIEAAIAAIPGTAGFVISSPAGNITSSAGHLPVRGTVTYT